MIKNSLIFGLLVFGSNLVMAGFSGPISSAKLITVKSMKSIKKDTDGFMEGHLIRQVDNQVYIFKDKTGQMRVKIKHSYFEGRSVSPKNKIRMFGEADYSDKFGSTGGTHEFDLDHFIIIK
ncbi:MAG: hypothetical protein DRQ51_04675 [Gammaproteobacteria bacterium]|nr:MAG: hypothetical protein DRQ51_04675 [Gammaproteobacteria bacterium]